ncbi:hypothetical protein SAMN05192583_3135 [Sphingomonas gellani]|uniref:Uncharacterized protein n=1 Tax=Sphingomonas gellani TaxID=1166340 RepID=A0A1H8HX01_9SPHN|nr:hypothetical protein [Sphingomonas gellani]SEN60743.1 hypothetical protein SAMN05192583_3135 [Sphingomonas gellani]
MAGIDREAETRARLLETGRRAAETLGRSVADKPDDAPIETNIASLRGLAEVMSSLVDDAHRCGGIDCMGRSVDGVKLWVTRDRFEALERQAVRYGAALAAIAQAGETAGGDMDMLVDWQGTVRALSQVARRTLDAAPRDDTG